ncbi:zinc dependent phospholipase C family protein [Ruminococcaceae bacterium OttesenSCG-928-A16]|nr:zinc dependent phospholipase C family protein [Ruminococcaceae bacterium OttesenSCG-928-A16]
MPECYTHSHIAAQALVRSGQVVASHPAFLAGANGPGPLYMYKIWRRNPHPNLPALANKMQHEKTGAFLNALVHLAITPVQQSYALGFLTHYVADCILHPYVAAMCQTGAPYSMPNGHSWMESSLDSTLYHQSYKTYFVPLHAGTPVLITEDLAQVANLLREAISQVYERDIPTVALSDTFHDNLKVRGMLISKHGGKRALAALVEPLRFAKKGKGFIRSHMQPAAPLKKLPTTWVNPYTGVSYNITTEEILTDAEAAAANCITAAMGYWLGNLDNEQLAQALGNNDYFTGLPL